MSGEVRCVHTYEILNYANWDQPEMITLFGFGQPDEDKCLLFTPGYTAAIFGSTLSLLAEAMGARIDEVVEDHQVIYAEEPFDVARTHIAAGTISGARFQVKGLIDGVPRVVVDHVTKLRDHDFPEVRFEGEGYRAEVDGEPSVRLGHVALLARRRPGLRGPARLRHDPGQRHFPWSAPPSRASCPTATCRPTRPGTCCAAPDPPPDPAGGPAGPALGDGALRFTGGPSRPLDTEWSRGPPRRAACLRVGGGRVS